MIVCRTIPIYEVDVYLATDREEVRAFVRDRGMEADSQDVDDCRGVCMTVNDAEGQAHRLLCVFEPTAAVAVHEAVHMAWMVLKQCGIRVTQRNDEPLAYLTAWLAGEVMDLIKQVSPAPA